MSDTFLILVVSAALNGAVTWGVVKTKLFYMSRDISEARECCKEAHARINNMNDRRAVT